MRNATLERKATPSTRREMRNATLERKAAPSTRREMRNATLEVDVRDLAHLDEALAALSG